MRVPAFRVHEKWAPAVGDQMKPNVVAAAVALVVIPGCLQTVPEPYISAPQQQMVGGTLLSPGDDAPNPAHVVRSGSKVLGADPDPMVRTEILRNAQCYDAGCGE